VSAVQKCEKTATGSCACGWSHGGRDLSAKPETPEQERARLAFQAKQRKAWDEMMRRAR
jgi:hypothetical protein